MNRVTSAAKLLTAFAALWALGASLYILFTPVEIHSIEAAVTPGGEGTPPQEIVTQQSWVQAQGAWGAGVLFIFAGLYALPAWLAWRSSPPQAAGEGESRTAFIALILAALVALVLTFLAGFSIGGAYLPAALALLAGIVLLGLGRAAQKDA